VWNRPDMQHVLKRAVGLDQHLVPDYLDGELHPDDIFMLCCDGVWEPLGDKRIHEILFLHTDPQRAADELVRAALLAGGGDNATALVVRVDSLPKEDWRDLLQAGKQLPLPARLKPGQRIDGFEVLQLLHESRATLLYKVRSGESGQIYALKTLQPAFADDKQSCEGLLAEEWLAKRLVSPHFPHIIPLAGDARHFLYYVMSYHEGTTLQYQIDQGTHFTVASVMDVSTRMLKGLGALHRLSITHRDIKPANLHIGKDSGLRILDMGLHRRKAIYTRQGSRCITCSHANILTAKSSRFNIRASAMPFRLRVIGRIFRCGWKILFSKPSRASRNIVLKQRKKCCWHWSAAILCRCKHRRARP
jgi:Protein kinase domain